MNTDSTDTDTPLTNAALEIIEHNSNLCDCGNPISIRELIDLCEKLEKELNIAKIRESNAQIRESNALLRERNYIANAKVANAKIEALTFQLANKPA